jgi:hypothetical protein
MASSATSAPAVPKLAAHRPLPVRFSAACCPPQQQPQEQSDRESYRVPTEMRLPRPRCPARGKACWSVQARRGQQLDAGGSRVGRVARGAPRGGPCPSARSGGRRSSRSSWSRPRTRMPAGGSGRWSRWRRRTFNSSCARILSAAYPRPPTSPSPSAAASGSG